MDAPTDLDESVAKHVMSWQPCPVDFRPSSHWPDTRRMIDRVHERVDREDRLEDLLSDAPVGYITILYTGELWAVSFNYDAPEDWWDQPGDIPYTGLDESLERACCIAALGTCGVDAE